MMEEIACSIENKDGFSEVGDGGMENLINTRST